MQTLCLCDAGLQLMILLVPLIILLIPALMLGINLAATPPTNVDYSSMAYNKAASAYYDTGTVPSTVNVMGANVSPGVVDTTELSYQAADNLAWERINAEQVLLTACNQIMTKCNTSVLSDVWSFLPANTGTVQSLLTATPAQNTITCGVTSTYAPYARYLIQQSLAAQDITQTVGARIYNFYYNKPTTGSGCLFVDVVYAQ